MQQEGEKYWEDLIELCCPILKGKINIKDLNIMKKAKKYNKRNITLLYHNETMKKIDPNQS